MNQNPLESKLSDTKSPTQEKLAVRVEIATEKDWEAYKKIRLESINGPDANMFGPKTAAKDRAKSNEEWKSDLITRADHFVVMSWQGSEAIGLSSASERREKGLWHLGSAYVKPELRGGLGKKMLALRMREIIRRGGKKVEAGMRPNNEITKHLCGSFGFKKAPPEDVWEMMEADLTDPVVIKKINEVLDAG